MNPVPPSDPRAELEARLTALLLGELPAAEAAALERTLAADPQLAKLRDELRRTIGLVRQTVAAPAEPAGTQPEPLRLSDERRQKLLAHFQTVPLRPANVTVADTTARPRRDLKWLLPMAAAVIAMLVGAALFLPALSKAKGHAKAITPIAGRREGAMYDYALVESQARQHLGVDFEGTAGNKLFAGVVVKPVAVDLMVVAEVKDASAKSQFGNIVLPAAVNEPVAGTVLESLMEGDERKSEGFLAWNSGGGGGNPPPDQSGNRFVGRNAFFAQPESLALGEASINQAQGIVAPVRVDPATGALIPVDAPGLPAITAADTASAEGGDGAKTDFQKRLGSIVSRAATGSGGIVAAGDQSMVTDGDQLKKSGAGTLTVSGGNTFAGGTSLSVGAFKVDAAPGNSPPASPARELRAEAPVALALPEPAARPIPLLGDLPTAGGVFRSNGDRGPQPSSPGSEADGRFRVFREAGGVTLGGGVASGNGSGGQEVAGANRGGSLSDVTKHFYQSAGTSPQSVYVNGQTGTITGQATESDLAVIDQANKMIIKAGALKRPPVQGVPPPAPPTTPPPLTTGLRTDGDNERQLAEVQLEREVANKDFRQYLRGVSPVQRPAVEIVDPAKVEQSAKPSLLGRLSTALTGGVERTASISVGGDDSVVSLMGRAQTSGAYDPNFVRTEAEKIESKLVLYDVIDKLKLDEAWASKDGNGRKLSRDEAFKRLQDKIEVAKNPTSNLLEIRAKGATPAEAAQIANTVAEVYRDVSVTSRAAMGRSGIAVLNQRLAEQEKLVASAKEQLEKRKVEPAPEPSDPPPPRKPASPAPVPQPEVLARDNAFSTFSLNVSDVSFKLAAASLAQGQMPDRASVRAEEFLNAFDYRDPQAAPGAPVAFAWERARAPFAHNRDLLRFSLQTAASGRQAGRPLNLVLVLDNSGSMERADRVRIVHEGLRALATLLQPADKLSVITFARTPRLRVDGAPGSQAAAVAEQVGGLTPEGGTNLEEALRLAYATATRHYLASGINHVVLLTDGAANLGDVDPASLQRTVEAHRRQGIALDCFGVGWEGFNDDLLETLARNGDGRYGFLNSPAEAASGFAASLAGALRVAASDVKVQVEFNPRRVNAWRQIGYAKHQLTKEQFRDNTVDAAELTAQEAGNALYTVEVNPRGEGPLATVRARFKVPGTTEYREHAWEVPFTGNAPGAGDAPATLRLAATASAFAEWLVASPFAGEVTPDRLLELLRGVPEVFGADAQPRTLEEMIRQAKSAGGR